MNRGSFDESMALCDSAWHSIDSGDLDAAAGLFRRASELGWVGGTVSLGYVYGLQGDDAAAAACYRSALATSGLSDEERRVRDHAAARLAGLAFNEAWRHAQAAADAHESFDQSEAMFREVFLLVEQATASDSDWDAAEGALAGAQAAMRVSPMGQIGQPHFGVSLELLRIAFDCGDEEQLQRAQGVLEDVLLAFEVRPLSRSFALLYEPGADAWEEFQRRGLVPRDSESQSPSAPVATTSARFCSQCGGARPNEAALFCSSCGSEYV